MALTALLQTLLRDWESSRDAEVADRIDRITRLLPSDAVRVAQMELPNLTRKEAAGMLDQARKRPPDPRWGPYLAGWLDTRPFVSGRGVWTATFELLGHTGDPRTLERLQQGIDSMPFDTAQHVTARRWTSCLDHVVRVEGTPRTVDLDEIDAVLVPVEVRHERLQAEIRQLWERVASDRDLESALVLGDRLSELGDPRGEFVQLQCIESPSAQVRMRILGHLNLHRRQWLGTLAPVVHKRGLEFQRGVLHAAAMAFKSQAQLEALLDAPQWDSIRDLAVNPTVSWGHRDTHPLLTILPRHPQIHTVREVAGWRLANPLLFGGRPLMALHCWSESRQVWRSSPSKPSGTPISMGLIEVPYAGVDTLVRWIRGGVQAEALRVRYVMAPSDYGRERRTPDEAEARAVHRRLHRYCRDVVVCYGRGNKREINDLEG